MSAQVILIVDDSQDVHDVVGAYLEASGYAVRHAINGAAGLDAMREVPPDLVLLDIQMPVMDGFGVLSHMKEDTRLSRIPVLFLSSLDRPNLKVKGLEEGADDYIVKPFDRAELMARVTVALRRGTRVRRLEQTFGGSLGPMTVEEILQTMDFGGKSGRMTLPDSDAAIEVAGRRVMRARWGGFEGISALHRILIAGEGRFEVEFEADIEAAEVNLGKIQDVLMSAMVALDETKRELGEKLTFQTLVSSSGKGQPLEFPHGFSPVWPLRIAEVISRMGGSLKDNAKTVGGAVAFGAMAVVGE